MTPPIRYHTNFYLSKKEAMQYQYGMLNNKISLNIPIENTELKLKLDIKVSDIFSMNINKMSIDKDSFENTIKQLQGR
tara:strand:+ start:2186 stop:2419 length:234 start_codon:yes stop_codon:yes gene_type:complete